MYGIRLQNVRDKLAVRDYHKVLDVESPSDAARHMVRHAPWYGPTMGALIGAGLGTGTWVMHTMMDAPSRSQRLRRNNFEGGPSLTKHVLTGAILGGLGGYGMHRHAVANPDMYEHPVYWGPISGRYAPDKVSSWSMAHMDKLAAALAAYKTAIRSAVPFQKATLRSSLLNWWRDASARALKHSGYMLRPRG